MRLVKRCTTRALIEVLFDQKSRSNEVNIQPGHDRHPHSVLSISFNNYSFLDLEGGKFFFNTVKEGDSVLFATEDEQVRRWTA